MMVGMEVTMPMIDQAVAESIGMKLGMDESLYAYDGDIFVDPFLKAVAEGVETSADIIQLLRETVSIAEERFAYFNLVSLTEQMGKALKKSYEMAGKPEGKS